MDNKMKKSKYAALVLASTLALSTVATTAPQAFGGEGITAQAVSVNDTYKSVALAEGATDKATTIKIAGTEYAVTLAEGTATLTIGKKNQELKQGAIVSIDGLNLKVTTASATELLLTVLEQQTAGGVTETIKDLAYPVDVKSDLEAYKQAVTDAREAYKLLPADEQTKVKNEALLKVHEELVKADNALAKQIEKLPLAADIKKIVAPSTKDSGKDGVYDILTENKKTRVINKDLETDVTNLTDFTNAKLEKDQKAALAAVVANAKDVLKLAKAQQKVIAGYSNTKVFEAALKGLTTGAEFTTPEEQVTVSKKGAFKLNGDAYKIETVEGKLTLTNDAGAVTLSDKNEFTIDEKDTASDVASTLNDTYQLVADGTEYKVMKKAETIKLEKAVPVLSLDTKMSVKAYKTLKTGVKKYSDAQIEAITAVSKSYKGLDSTAKKEVSKADAALIKKYEKALKAQQSLEKKLVAEDSKGVTQQISKLKYSDTYAADVAKARAAYDDLTDKYKKKVKAATLTKLKNHEKALPIINSIDVLPVAAILTAKTETDLTALENAITAISEGSKGTTGTYDKADKTVKSLVKNYKNLATYTKQIAAQKEFLKDADKENSSVKLLAAWQDAYKAVTGTTDARILNNQFVVGAATYAFTYDKVKQETTISTVTIAEKKVTLDKVATVKDPAKGAKVVPVTVKIGDTTLNVTAAKGKFTKVDVVDSTITAIKVPESTYAEADYNKVKTAVDAYTAVQGNKQAAKLVNKEDKAAYTKYAAKYTAQQKTAVAAIKTAVAKPIVFKTAELATPEAALAKVQTLVADNVVLKALTKGNIEVDAANKKVKVKIDAKTTIEVKFLELTEAEATAKTALDKKTVEVDNGKKKDAAAVLAAVKALAADNTVVKALEAKNLKIEDGKVTVTLPSGDTATVTVTEKAAETPAS